MKLLIHFQKKLYQEYFIVNYAALVYHSILGTHDDVIKWKHFPRNWPFVRGIHRSPVNSPPLKGQWRGALMFSLICAWIKGWVNNREAGDLRHHRVHYDVIVMVAHTDRLLHSPSLVAPGLSGVWNMNSNWLRETWPLIGCHCCSVIVGVNIGWDCLSCSGLWAHLTRGNFHHFQRLLTLTLWAVQGDCQTDSPLAQPKEQVNLSAISVVQGDCERVYPTDNATGNMKVQSEIACTCQNLLIFTWCSFYWW